MTSEQGRFKVIEQHDCPHYVVGDEFTISGTTLTVPHNKPLCLLLSQAVAEYDLQDFADGRDHRQDDCTINCKGCTGVVKLYVGERREDSFHTPQMQMLARAEEKRLRAKKLGMFEGLLKGSHLFEWMDDRLLSGIVAKAKTKTVAAGEIVVHKGTQGKYLYIITTGKVAVSDETGEYIAFLGRGDVFGEMSLFSGQPVCATIRTVETTQLLLLSGKDFAEIITRYPFLSMAFTRLLVERLHAANLKRRTDNASAMAGRLEEITSSEVFLLMHENRKSGVIEFDLPGGNATVAFHEGEIVRAEYKGERGETAFYHILKVKSGRFRLVSSLPLSEMTRRPIGNFMKVLMEGLRLVDEDDSAVATTQNIFVTPAHELRTALR